MSDRHKIDRMLERYEPESAPERRYNRIVRVGAADVLEMRDPNDGQSMDPADKTRHQYVVAGGMLWYRRLPPENVGDEWEPLDWQTGIPEHVWTARVNPRKAPELVRAYMESAVDLPVAVLRREPIYVDGERHFCIRGEYVEAGDNDVRIEYGPVTHAWWDVPLPTCPDCHRGHVVWWEADYVPGTRKCVGTPIGRDADGTPQYDSDRGCGSLFRATTEGGR